MIRILLSTRLGERRWTQADLARKTGIRPTTINDLYHEMAERINLEHLDLICEVLGCDISDIIVRVPNAKKQIRYIKNRSSHYSPKDLGLFTRVFFNLNNLLNPAVKSFAYIFNHSQ